MADDHSLPLAPPTFANPLPPQRRPVPQTPMSNSDFRKLLSTPRPDRTPARTPAAAATLSSEGGAARAKKPHRPKHKSAGEGESGEDAGASYRDRAAERRDDANPDYAGMAVGAALPTPHVSGFALGAGAASGADAAALSVEESKFMGGDAAHTHLVKGLDFALLQKVRAEQAARDAEAAHERVEAERATAAPSAAVVRTSLGRALHAFVTGQRRTSTAAAERFAHGRVAFVFNLAEAHAGSPAASELPTTLLRSRADVCDAPETLSGAADAPLLRRMGELMSHMRLGSRGSKKLRRKEGGSNQAGTKQAPEDALHGALPRLMGVAAPGAAAQMHALTANAAAAAAPAAPLPAAADEEDDIFGDAGRNYVCEPAKRAAAVTAAFAGAPQLPRSYFGQSDVGGETAAPVAATAPTGAAGAADDLELQAGAGVDEVYAEIEAAERAAGGGAAAAAEAEAARAEAAAARLRKLQELEEDSAYGDLYPGGEGYALDLGGSDDDAPPVAAATAAGATKGKGGKGKAAAPPDEGKARDAKLSTQLQDIRRTLTEKHGDKHEGAFAKRERGGDATPAPAALGGEEGEAKARAKRLRL